MVATPLDAATVVLMRDVEEGDSSPEVLLLKRHSREAFAAGAYVFPGGVFEDGDYSPEALALSPVLSPEVAVSRVPDVASAEKAQGLWIAALRETFEESGILLAREVDGRLWRASASGAARLARQREALRLGEVTFVEIVRDMGLTLATDLLVYFAHWITPESRPMRFSTRFFLAPVPVGLNALPDQVEVVEQLWICPEEALERHAHGELEMMTVTTKILQSLTGCASAAEAVARLRDTPVETVLPRAVRQTDGTMRVLYPWDEAY